MMIRKFGRLSLKRGRLTQDDERMRPSRVRTERILRRIIDCPLGEAPRLYQRRATKKACQQQAFLVAKRKLCPALVLDPVGHDRDIDILAVVGLDSPVNAEKPDDQR